MPAGHIVATHVLAEGVRNYGTGEQTPQQKADVMAYKRKDNATSRARANSAGVHAPVVLTHDPVAGKPMVLEGHHRLTGAYDRSPREEVPVIHTDINPVSAYRKTMEYYPNSF